MLCATGAGADGLKLLQRTVEKTKDDYYHHAWGGGAYYMEAWGIGALDAGNKDVAEEAFLEALAHDSGSAERLWAWRRFVRASDARTKHASLAALHADFGRRPIPSTSRPNATT